MSEPITLVKDSWFQDEAGQSGPTDPVAQVLVPPCADLQESPPEEGGDTGDGVEAEPVRESLPGFRLERIEVYNWGTFNGSVSTLYLGGENGFMTGDQGSGKSTIVDAITTLLVPPARIVYNKAAGAESGERNLRSYVLGHHKTERIETSAKGKPVPLRGNNDFSVILGVFRCAVAAGGNDADKVVTLAQVYWIKDPSGMPERFYVMADGDLTISRDFSQFGSDMSQLRKRLKALGAEVETSFTAYGVWFRKRLGIGSEQAMNLFHQTISLKTVSSLTEFVRTFMLEPSRAPAKVKALIDHFEDLNRAHETVLRAKRQAELLEPIVADSDKYSEVTSEIVALEMDRDALRSYFAGKKLELLTKRIEGLEAELDKLDRLNTEQVTTRDVKIENTNNLRAEIVKNGGDRLQRLKADKVTRSKELSTRRDRDLAYGALALKLGEPGAACDEDGFIEQQGRLATRRAETEAEILRCQEVVTQAGVDLKIQRDEHKQVSDELASLRLRRSNIPMAQVAIRLSICRALGLAEDSLPFVGELIRVREGEKDWEGAAERILRPFGLGMIVPEQSYAAVSEYVNKNNLRGRLVYHRVSAKSLPLHQSAATLRPDSLVLKLEINPDSVQKAWLERELASRFDLACCDTLVQFQHEPRAVTQAGQIKFSAERHEKDDRYAITDASRFVLGWTNAAKIALYEHDQKSLETRISALANIFSKAQATRVGLDDRKAALCGIDQYPTYSTIDWRSVAQEIVELDNSISEIERSSDRLALLNDELTAEEAALAELEGQMAVTSKASGALQEKACTAEIAKEEASSLVKPMLDLVVARLDALLVAMFPEHRLTVESCSGKDGDLRERIQSDISHARTSRESLRDRITRAMTNFTNEYRLETSELDAHVDAADGYREMLERLKVDDLPRFEGDFKEMLNENAINEIVELSSELVQARDGIKGKIERINESLTRIDYNRGRYIMLDCHLSPDIEIRSFLTDMAACTEGSVTTGADDAQYSEARFLRVKELIDRFRGREGQSEQDRLWTQRVTDVRNWYIFSACEKWREDDRIQEYYPDAGGKSGGQKEKLAYTVLAASLAYQFGLEADGAATNTFRFVLIDEAFAKGTDESANYALNLFTQMGLQMLVVTPLLKIHVIEPFVSSVGLVDNENGSSSKLRNLTIREFREKRAQPLFNPE